MRARARRAHVPQPIPQKYPSAFSGAAHESCTPYSPVDQASTGLLRLNLETRAFHDAADEAWLRLLQPSVSRADYMRQLVTAYGFEAPLEAAFAYTPNLKLFVDLRQRSRAGLLAQDLLALGLRANEVSQLPQCMIAPFTSPLEAMGWLYVTERSTLLHERVRTHLQGRIPGVTHALAYLRAYEGMVNARWNELGHAIDRAVRTEPHLHDLIASAKAAFRHFTQWSQRTSSVARGA